MKKYFAVLFALFLAIPCFGANGSNTGAYGATGTQVTPAAIAAAGGITNGQPSVILGTNLLFGVGGYTQGLFNIASSATTPGQINIGDWFGQKNSTLISVDDTTGIENIELFANEGIILFANITNSTGGYYGNGIGLTNIQAQGISTNGGKIGSFPVVQANGRVSLTNMLYGNTDVPVLMITNSAISSSTVIRIGTSAALTTVISSLRTGDGFSPYLMNNDGSQVWGGGVLLVDSKMSRVSPQTMQITNNLNVPGALSSGALVVTNTATIATNIASWTGQISLPLLLTATNYFTNTYGARGWLHIDYVSSNMTSLGSSFFMVSNITSGVGRWKQSNVTGASVEIIPGEITLPVSPNDVVLVTNIANYHVVAADYSQ